MEEQIFPLGLKTKFQMILVTNLATVDPKFK